MSGRTPTLSKIPKPAPWARVSLAEAFREAVEDTAPKPKDETGPKPLTEYADDPVGFVEDVLGIPRETVAWSLSPEYRRHTWDGTVDPLRLALESIANHQWVGVSSGTGTGKTFLMACALLWWIAVRKDAIAVTVATKEDQMAKGVWREVGRLFPRFQGRFPAAELTHLRIRVDPDRGDAWGAWAVTAAPKAGESSATSVQGLHAAHLLILVDEMPGVPQPIITALENTATDDGNIIAGFGNPDNDTDPLAKFSRSAGVVPIRISGLDHPNVVCGRTLVPGAVSVGSITKRRNDYGEESPFFKSRVRGIAPAQAEDALVHRVWCEQAVERGRAWALGDALKGFPYAFGVDPSNSDGGDEAAVARFRGPLCEYVRAKPCPNANNLGATVLAEAQALGTDPKCIGVDSIGVGAGTVNEMHRLLNGGHCSPLNSGAAPIMRAAKAGEEQGWEYDANQFLNLRAQMYWQAREDLRKGRVGLPNDPQLIEELIMPTYEIRNGKVVVEAKAKIKERLGRSPNKADAFVYGNWVRPRTRPAPGVPEHAKDKHLGLTVDPSTGKRRPTTVRDLAKRPDLGNANDPRYWASWGKG